VRFLVLFSFLLAFPVIAAPTENGLKIVVYTKSDRGFHDESTQYIASDRRRREYRSSSGSNFGPPLALISRCDLDQNFELNLQDKQFVSAPLPHFPSEAEWQALAAKFQPPPKPPTPTILIEGTTVDTGERKKLFGYEARHVITTRKQTRLNGDTEGNSESVTDGWYTDLSTKLSCDPKFPGRPGYVHTAFLTAGPSNQPPDVPTFKIVGKPEEGFALSTKTTNQNTYSLPDGSKKVFASTDEMEVTELYSGPLDQGLFEVPKGFTKVQQIRRNPPIPLSMLIQEYWNSFRLGLSRIFH
jgi:hypothetical protein